MRTASEPAVACPVRGCGGRRTAWQVLCARHWWRVPSALRRRVWRLYRDAPGSPEHLQVLDEAVALAAAIGEGEGA